MILAGREGSKAKGKENPETHGDREGNGWLDPNRRLPATKGKNLHQEGVGMTNVSPAEPHKKSPPERRALKIEETRDAGYWQASHSPPLRMASMLQTVFSSAV